MPRSRLYPSDDVTAAEDAYLEEMHPFDAGDRRDRLALMRKRLARKNHDPKRLHDAIEVLMQRRYAHEREKERLRAGRGQNYMVATATQDLKWAIASLRKLLPPGEQMTDDELLRRRRELLVPVDLGPVPPSRRGRPLQDWKHDGDAELRRAGLNASDRRELLAVLGFVED